MFFFFFDKLTKIYIDTNILECRHGNSLFLDSFKISADFYKLSNHIQDKGLSDKVKICIPKIVIEEMKEHFLECFSSEIKKLEKDFDKHKATFGELLDLYCKLKIVNIAQYEEFISQCIEKVIIMNEGLFTIIEYPNCFPIMIRKAIKTIKPFTVAGGNNKKYSDAGFKDALVIESILSHCDLENENVILFSDDNDFNGVIDNENFQVINTLDKVLGALAKIYKSDPLAEVKKLLESTYYREMLLTSVDCKLDDSVKDFAIKNIEQIEDNEYRVEQSCTVNETKYTFSYDFDAIAKEISSLESTITNE